ncbi:MAG: GerMN domain-containing protein [Pleurocapsa sp.]
MQDKEKSRLSIPVIATIVGVIIAAGGGAAWWAKHSIDVANQSSTPTPPPITQTTPSQPPQPITEEKTIQVSWLNPNNNTIELVSKTLNFQKSVESERVLEIAFEHLLSKPTEPQYTTAIPQGTKLLGIEVKPNGIHLNFSQEFTSGGGSASMSSRLAQVIYTATSSDAGDHVWISVEGKPLEYLGGEGIIISQPMTREDFQANFTL